MLGTIVAIRATAPDEAAAHAALSAAFDTVAHVHARMSFQSPTSDLARVVGATSGEAVVIDPATAECLGAALLLAEASDGVFDPVLPGACWRDVGLTGQTMTVAHPLRIDLSGIAKGFAVDRACEVLIDAGCSAGRVNAGGDLRLFGAAETIVLAPAAAAPPAAVHIQGGALASSDVAGSQEEYGAPQHRDGRTGATIEPRFVSVAAPLCRDADALTKVVLVLGAAAQRLLTDRGAVAYVHDEQGWWSIGDGA